MTLISSYISTSISISISISTSTSTPKSKSKSIYIYTSTSISTSISLSLYIYICVFVMSYRVPDRSLRFAFIIFHVKPTEGGNLNFVALRNSLEIPWNPRRQNASQRSALRFQAMRSESAVT